ncbi:unnamed protein product [Closterium sp. Naga37s-1]|nr:unnamed protein product [Closterium sp. Naga37s-1]
MEALDGPVLFRVADATGDAVTTIANVASVSRAFARVARSELWPCYCLARAALAEDGEAAAVAAVAERLVREAGSADAPRNAASSLARCMSACPGVIRACSIALRLNAAAEAKSADAESGEAESGEAEPGEAEPGEAEPGEAEPGEAEPGEAEPGEAGSGPESGRWSRSSAEDSTESRSETEEDSGADRGSVGAGGGKGSDDANPHVSDSCALSSSLATRLFLDECFLPAPPFGPSPLFLGGVEGDKRGKAREEDGGEGAHEGAAVLMAAGRCGREHEAEGIRCHEVWGAIAGFKHSRFHSLLQGQPVAPDECLFCHDQVRRSGEAAAWRGGVEWGMRRGGGGVAAASPLTNPHIPTPNQPTPFNLTPHFNRPLEPLSLPPFLPPYPSPPTMIPVQSFTGGAAGHKWGCWSQVGLLVTGGAAGPGVTALVLVPGAGVTALVPVPGAGVTALVPVPGAGVTALVLVHGADGARRVGRTADGLQAGRDLTVGGAQALVRSPVRWR